MGAFFRAGFLGIKNWSLSVETTALLNAKIYSDVLGRKSTPCCRAVKLNRLYYFFRGFLFAPKRLVIKVPNLEQRNGVFAVPKLE